MSTDELRDWNPHKFLEHKILEAIPFVFNNNFNQFLLWKSNLSHLIQVDSRAFVIVGSAAIGYSINPAKNFKVFDKNSDIDVAIISQFHFDQAWRAIRTIGTKYHAQTPLIQTALKDHRERLIYYGTIATDKILSVLPFQKEWTKAKVKLSEFEPTKEREINFRIYKDFESLRAYQILGLKTAQTTLLEKNDV